MPPPTSARRGSIKKCQATITITGRGWVCTLGGCPANGTKGQRFFPTFKAALNHERTAHDYEHSTLEDVRDVDVIRENRLPIAEETSCWTQIGQPRLTSEGLRQWEMHAHVDHVFDMVPFWQRGIDAAEKGEVLRLEEFLEKMEGDGGWRTANDVLGMLGEWNATTSEQAREPTWGQPRDDWAASQRGAWEPHVFGWTASEQGGWGVSSTRINASDATESLGGRNSGWGVREKWADGGFDFKVGRGKNEAWRRARGKAVGAVDGGREELHHFVDVIAQQGAVNEERRKQMHMFFEMPMEQKIKKIEETIRFLRTHV